MLTLIVVAGLLAAQPSSESVSLPVPQVDAPLLLDTRCEEPEWSGARRTPIGAGSDLLLMQNERNLYFCVTLPPESYGTLDLYISSPTAAAPSNLHVSAQVGERQRTAEGWPDWTFGNHRGWYSPPVALARTEVVERRPRLTFGSVAARELVIEKSKFGAGPWRMMFELRALGADKNGAINFPQSASVDDPGSWATLDLASQSSGWLPANAALLRLDSTALGEARDAWVYVPEACQPSAPCDVLLVLDAHVLFPLATAYAGVMNSMGRMAPLIVVGVPSRSPEDRMHNFTSSASSSERERYPQAGGGAKFLEFLDRELVPAVAARYPVSGRFVLAGHSLGGLFTIDALASGASFEGYIALSPTLSWNQRSALTALDVKLSASEAPTRRLFVSVADDTPPYLEAFTQLEAALSRQPSSWLRTSLQRFVGEDHVTTVAPGLQRAMKWFFVS